MKLRFLKLMLLLFILPLQMLAAELGVAGKQLAALPGVSNVETLKSTHLWLAFHQEQEEPACLYVSWRFAQNSHLVVPRAYKTGNHQSDRWLAEGIMLSSTNHNG